MHRGREQNRVFHFTLWNSQPSLVVSPLLRRGKKSLNMIQCKDFIVKQMLAFLFFVRNLRLITLIAVININLVFIGCLGVSGSMRRIVDVASENC